MHLKLISLNLKGFWEREKRFPQIISFFKEKNPDIIVLQEVCVDLNFSKNTALDLINKELNYPYLNYTKSFNYAEDYGKGILFNKETNKSDYIEEGLGVISKIPFGLSISDLSIKKGFDRWPRIAQQCDFGSFSLVNVHYSPSNSAILQREETPKKSIIIGDFNMKPIQIKDALGAYISSYDFNQYISYPSEKTTFDYCLLRNGKFNAVEIVNELSDHVGLFFEIELKN